MVVTLVHIWVKPEFKSEFIQASKENHLHSIHEEGNLRFDILQDMSNPNKFTFYEAYVSEEASAAHKNTDHYKKWRETVQGWMAKPREGIKHKILYPENF